MGLGISMKARIVKPKGMFKKAPGQAELMKLLAASVLGVVKDDLLKNLMKVESGKNSVLFIFHPAAEPVELRMASPEYIGCTAKTSTAGPGYHAFVVELFDQILKTMPVEPPGTDRNGTVVSDETGYFVHRDFKKLADEMIKFLVVMTSDLRSQFPNDNAQICLGLPMGQSIIGDYFAACPMGFLPRQYFETLSGQDSSLATQQAANFFPWWKRELNDEFWRNYGLVIAWQDLPWHPPASAPEKALYNAALSCFARAKRLAPNLPLPEKEIAEIKALLQANHEDPPLPAADGIGFNRRLRGQPLRSGWTIALPGYFYNLGDEESDYFVHGKKAAKLDCFSFPPGQAKSAGQIIAEVSKQISPDAEAIDYHKDHLLAKASIGQIQKGGETIWLLRGATAMYNRVCASVITFPAESDKTWAISTWQSIYRGQDEKGS